MIVYVFIMHNLYTLDEIENFTIKDIWKLYENFVNPKQVELISSFGFGNDTVNYAEGMYIYTKDNKKILDFTGGIGVLNLGHNHPRLLKARQKFSLKKKMEVHKNFFSPYIAALSSNIATLLNSNLKISYYPNSGAESVEGAVKLAYKYHNGERKIILHSDISFHGKTLISGNLTGSIETSYYSFQKTLNKDIFEYNNIESIKSLILKHKKNNKSDIYAIIVEPFNASSLLSCNEDFLVNLRKICNEENIILIFDEIYSGWFKTGEIFYYKNIKNLEPDILLTAKSLGGGKASISSYTTTKNIFNKSYGNLKDATLHSTTYNGFGEETATSIEAINIMVEDNFEKKSKEMGAYLKNSLLNIKKKFPNYIDEIRGQGCLQGIILKLNKFEYLINKSANLLPISFLKDKQIAKKIIVSSLIYHLYDQYNILTFYGSNKLIPLKISPSLIVEKYQIDYFIKSLETSLEFGLEKIFLKFIKNKIF